MAGERTATRVDPLGAAVGVGFPLAAAAVTLILTAAWQDRLPDPIASHWSGGGAPDGFTSLWSGAWLIAALIAVIGGGLGAVAAAAGVQLMLRRTMLVVSAAVTGLIATVDIVLLAGQLDVADPAEARLHAWSIGAGVLIGLVIGLPAAALLRDRRVRVPAPHPPDPSLPRAEPLRLPVTTTVGLSVPVSAAVHGLIAVIAVIVCVMAGSPWPLPLFLAGALLLAALSRYTVVLDERGLRVRCLGAAMLDYGADELAEARVRRVDPLSEFGGWGLRMRPGRRYGVVTRRGPGATVTMGGGDALTITTDDAERLAGAVNTLADCRG